MEPRQELEPEPELEPDPGEAEAGAFAAVRPAIRAGDRVELRPVGWGDDLYWAGTVQNINADGSYCVVLASGTVVPEVPPDRQHILPYGRREIFAGKEVVVSDGHTLLPGRGGSSPGEIVAIRLLAFKSSPQIVMSGLLLQPDGRSFRWSPVALEFVAALVCSVAFLHRRTELELGMPRFDSVWIGGGSGGAPMTAAKLFSQYLGRLDVVELDPEVMAAAQQYFGLRVDSGASDGGAATVSCHIADGATFLASVPPASYDLVVLDASDHDAKTQGTAMQSPSACFCTDEFLSGVLWPALRPGGLVVINAIGRQEQYVDFCEGWKANGFWPMYVLAIDPNCIFYAWKSGGDGANEATPEDTSTLASQADGLAMGHMDAAAFRELLLRTCVRDPFVLRPVFARNLSATDCCRRPGLAPAVPTVLDVLSRARRSWRNMGIFGWMDFSTFVSRVADCNWSLGENR
jgi:hypothetical protein